MPLTVKIDTLYVFFTAFIISGALYTYVDEDTIPDLKDKTFFERLKFSAPLIFSWIAWFVIVGNAILCSFVNNNTVPSAKLVKKIHSINKHPKDHSYGDEGLQKKPKRKTSVKTFSNNSESTMQRKSVDFQI